MKDESNDQEFVEWYNTYSDAIFRHCYFRLKGDRETAKEFVQETFIRTWKYRKTHEIHNIRAFLYRVATNLIINESRRAKRPTVSLDYLRDEKGFEPEDRDESNTIHSALEVEQILRVLDELPDEYREVVVLRYIDDLEPREIAEIKNTTANAVSIRLNRAIKKVKELFRYERQ